MSDHSIREYLKVLESGGGLVDFFYPVGSYYETSDTTFDPNVAWSGTWILEDEGLVHIGAGQTYIVGETGGEAVHVLTPQETAVRAHTHGIDGGNGDYFMTVNYGTVGGVSETQVATSNSSGYYAPTNKNSRVDFRARPGTDTATVSNGAAHNNMQPYIVVNRWHRTE